MAMPDAGDMAPPPANRAESVAASPEPPSLAIPDLTGVPGNELRKVTDIITVGLEGYGALYYPTFRQLQIKPERYDQFHNGVIRVIRNKHQTQLRRGTDAASKTLTDLLLRAFGSIVWKPDSGWCLDQDALAEDEVALVYPRSKKDRPDHTRFYEILDPLWQQMRNVMFVRRPPAMRRGRHASVARTTHTDGDDSYMADIDSRPSTPMVDPYERARATATRKVDALTDQVARRGPAAENTGMMDAEETDQALVELITRLAVIRARSDPRVFAELWEAHVMRTEELDAQHEHDEEDEDDDHATSTPARRRPQDDVPGGGRSQSNEPFMTSGPPARPRFPLSSSLRPALPSIMSVYITVSRLPFRTGASSSVTHTAAPQLTPAYHWASAPVENFSLGPCFVGLNYRIDVPASSVLGYTFSYGWNDTSRFISTGRPFAGLEVVNPDGQVAMEDDDAAYNEPGTHRPRVQGDQGDGRSHSSTDGVVNNIDPPSSSAPAPATAPRPVSGVDVDFGEPEWRVIALGWRDFQQDLQHAARAGVRVWRMKVCVVATSP